MNHWGHKDTVERPREDRQKKADIETFIRGERRLEKTLPV
jgi:hypothetical protein